MMVQVFNTEGASTLETEMWEALSLMDAAWPPFLATMMRHEMGHAVDTMRKLGPPHGWSMFLHERFMHECGLLITQKSNVESSLLHNYSVKVGSRLAAELRKRDLNVQNEGNFVIANV